MVSSGKDEVSESELLDVTELVHLRSVQQISPHSLDSKLTVNCVVDYLHRRPCGVATGLPALNRTIANHRDFRKLRSVVTMSCISIVFHLQYN